VSNAGPRVVSKADPPRREPAREARTPGSSVARPQAAEKAIELRPAPGAPGIEARWTSSAKTGVGTAIEVDSSLWFTLSHGIVNEVYYPRVDRACIRDMGFIVTDAAEFFSEEKRDAESRVRWLASGVPGFQLINTCRAGGYRIEKTIITDPKRSTLLQSIHFVPQRGTLADYHLYALLAPHLGNQGGDNTAWVENFEGVPVLFAMREGQSLALACSVPWLKRSVGYVGTSDGWHDLNAHHEMTWAYTRAEQGNVALTAEVDLIAAQGRFVVALGFGKDPAEAAHNALASLRDGFESKQRAYVAGWQHWIDTQATLHARVSQSGSGDLSAVSLAVLRIHDSKLAPGGLIASLAIPWGFSKGDKDLGGYHLVWPRDMVETAGGMLAAGAHSDARRALGFLRSTQNADGHWSQNMWLDGSVYWDGIQMDETALPIVLVGLALQEAALTPAEVTQFWPMVRRAAGYLARNGPVSPLDRWEEDPGYTPFTVAAEISALLIAADIAEHNQEPELALYLRDTADIWYASIDRWMYVSSTDWSFKFGVAGYYVRIAPRATADGVPVARRAVDVKNTDEANDSRTAGCLVSPDALALVRFGLRRADDPRMRDTATVVDALLKIETPTGPTWHRYNDDGYGEHEDGSPFDGTGIGRGWPLLTGERAHFELSAGRVAETRKLMQAMESFANEGLIPEQVWDSSDLPERGLRLGRPSGSAMPLVWAHAEYLKLRRSLGDGRVFDMPHQTQTRYLTEKKTTTRRAWRFNHRLRAVSPGTQLRVEALAPAMVHWSADDWQTTNDVMTRDVGLGVHIADLMTEGMNAGSRIRYTFYWPAGARWEGRDFVVSVEG
jgi:glucoamylase